MIEHFSVIVKVIADYDYITNATDYDYIAFESNDYDYHYYRSCNRLQSNTFTDYEYPIPDQTTTYHIFITFLKYETSNLTRLCRF